MLIPPKAPTKLATLWRSYGVALANMVGRFASEKKPDPLKSRVRHTSRPISDLREFLGNLLKPFDFSVLHQYPRNFLSP